MTERHELWKLADGIQMDLRAAQGKMTSLRSYLAGLNLPEQEQSLCPRCGVSLPGERTLAEHLYVSHGGPEPAHWVEIDALAADLDVVESASEGSSGSPAHTADCEQADAA